MWTWTTGKKLVNEVASASSVQMFFVLLGSCISLICFAGSGTMLVPSLYVLAHILK